MSLRLEGDKIVNQTAGNDDPLPPELAEVVAM
jgi:hypothetical protein